MYDIQEEVEQVGANMKTKKEADEDDFVKYTVRYEDEKGEEVFD